MAREQFHVLTCDRCGHSVEVRRPGDDDDWAKVSALSKPPLDARPARIGPESGTGSDICPGCVAQLFDWWKTPDGVEQSSISRESPPPVLEKRPRVHLRERKVIATLIGKGLDETIEVTVALVREEGAAFLTGGREIGRIERVGLIADQLTGDIVATIERRK